MSEVTVLHGDRRSERGAAEPCIHCKAMALEIQELRAELGLSGRLTDQRAMERAFGLSRSEARVAQALYDAGGRVVPRSTLESVGVGETARLEGSDNLKVVICRVRSKISRGAIDTAEGGYAMTQEGRSLIYTALKVGAAT